MPQAGRSCLAVVLAAGEGTRMRSARPKVLHAIAGRSMLEHVLAAVAAADITEVAVVLGPTAEPVRRAVTAAAPQARIFVQAERRGTAHAVLAARAALADGHDDVLVLFADTPLVEAATLSGLRAARADGAALAVLGFEAADPRGYGRLLRDGDALMAIREEKDASEAERAIRLCNAGLMVLDGRRALDLLDAIGSGNAQNEFYLTDAVAVARSRGWSVGVCLASADEVMGVNDRRQLAAAEAVAQRRLRDAAMLGGATLVDPSSVTLAYDTMLDHDVTVEPHVVFGRDVRVGQGSTIRAFSHLEGATVGAGATVGPFARLRPGADLAEGVHIGNFVEIKAATVEAGAKINHLSYIGDAHVGARVNIGAGTVTCNYDGFGKYRTEIGADAFVGVHSALVAPVSVGAGAFVGTGSVVTADVAPDALVVARARQVEKPGWARAFRARRRRETGREPEE